MTDPTANPIRADLTRIARLRAAPAARRAGLSAAREAALINAAACQALDGYLLSPEELAAGAELLAGRLDVAGCRRWLDV